MREDFSASIRKFFAKHDTVAALSIAMIIGVAAGFGNIIFRSLIHFFQGLFFGIDSEVMLTALEKAPVWQIILIPAFGGLLVGVIKHFVPSANGSGVSEVIKSISFKTPISIMKGIMRTLTSGITLGSGGSAGREGPIVLIGAAIGSTVGRLFKLSSNRLSTSIACGASGGLAATFNTPMSGAMFSAEVLMGEFGLKTFSPIMISAVTATVISRYWYGNKVTFAAPEYIMFSHTELILYAIMGAFIAVTSVFFIRFNFFVAEYFGRLQVPTWVKPAIGGLMMGVIAVFCRNIMGVGYGTIMQILDSNLTGFILLVFVFLKIVATSLTLGSGGAGGHFVPSLFIGASAGGFFGWFMQLLFPEIAGSGTYALVGMAAMLGAVMRAPITSIFMIFEITQSYQIVLPAMLACIIAYVVDGAIEKDSIFTWTLSREGFKFGKGVEQSVLGSIYVRDIMLTDIIRFREDTTFVEIRQSIERKPHAYFPVVDNNDYLTGIISLNDLKTVFFKNEETLSLTAKDMGIRKNIITVREDETLLEAMVDFGIKDVGDLPVVRHTPQGLLLIGLLRRSDIIIAYNKRIVDFAPSPQ